MQNYDRLSIMVSLVLLGLVLMLIVRLPTRIIQATVFGTPVTVALSSQLIMVLLLSALTAIGTEYIMRAHPHFGEGKVTGYSFLFWILPTFVTLGAAWFTPLLLKNLIAWLIGLAFTAAVLSSVVVAEYHTINPKDPSYTSARLFLNLVTYISALMLFTAIYQTKLRSIISATVVIFFATLLGLALLRAEREATSSTWVYSAICGLILGQATWALNYWGVGGLAGGGLLVLIFYFLTGIAQHKLLNRLNKGVLFEFSLIGVIGLLVLATQGALSW